MNGRLGVWEWMLAGVDFGRSLFGVAAGWRKGVLVKLIWKWMSWPLDQEDVFSTCVFGCDVFG